MTQLKFNSSLPYDQVLKFPEEVRWGTTDQILKYNELDELLIVSLGIRLHQMGLVNFGLKVGGKKIRLWSLCPRDVTKLTPAVVRHEWMKQLSRWQAGAEGGDE